MRCPLVQLTHNKHKQEKYQGVATEMQKVREWTHSQDSQDTPAPMGGTVPRVSWGFHVKEQGSARRVPSG